MPLTDAQRMALANAVRRALRGADPDWTGGNAADPGVTILEALAYALDDLGARPAVQDGATRAIVQRIAETAARLAGTAADVDASCGNALARPRYFQGKLLAAQDFTAEQDYFRARLRRHNRRLHGWGVVDGFEVAVEAAATGDVVRVQPGLALDPQGEEIELHDEALVPVGSMGSGSLFVLVRYEERPCDPQPTPSPDGAAVVEPSRIAETCAVVLTTAVAADAVAIARLVQRRARWRVDPRFKVARAR